VGLGQRGQTESVEGKPKRSVPAFKRSNPESESGKMPISLSRNCCTSDIE